MSVTLCTKKEKHSEVISRDKVHRTLFGIHLGKRSNMNVKDVFCSQTTFPETNSKHFKKMMELMYLNELCRM